MTATTPQPAVQPRPAHSRAGASPRLPAVPGGAVAALRAQAAQAALSWVARRLPIQIHAPGGRAEGAGGPTAPSLVIHRERDFYRRLGAGAAGFAESHMAGDWDSDDLVGLFTVFAERLSTLAPAPVQVLRRWYVPREPAADDATVEGARRNIERHYDLSDEMFALFLDPSMTYSSALFAPGDTLADAQRRKIDTLLDRVGAGPDCELLEIGSGWGELAVRAAARGTRVTTLTISPSQWAAARRRAVEAGVAHRVDVQLRDYREAAGTYDAIVSVEMVEAVGERYWPAYFCAIDRLLAPGGRAGLQAITMPHERMLATRGGHTWIHKYIFPGGQIPSLDAIAEVLRRHTSLRVTADFPMGPHYARTLEQWRRRFNDAAEAVDALGFTPEFRRMWNLYLAYCEAGFRAGYLDVHQLILERGT